MASSHGAPLFLRSTAETKLEINDNIMIRLAATSSTTTKNNKYHLIKALSFFFFDTP